jgi:hypothetical protein
VRRADAGVDDVGVDACARVGVVVGGRERQVALVDAVEAPRGALLRRGQLDDAVLLDVLDERVAAQSLGLALGQSHGEAAQRVAVDVLEPTAVRVGELRGQCRDPFGGDLAL